MSNVSQVTTASPFSRESAPDEDPGARTSGVQVKAQVPPVPRMKPKVFSQSHHMDRVLVHLDAKSGRRDARYSNKPKMK